jgi:hypothetical protein
MRCAREVDTYLGESVQHERARADDRLSRAMRLQHLGRELAIPRQPRWRADRSEALVGCMPRDLRL